MTHVSRAEEGWAELLANGLSFDLLGLAPAAAAPMPVPGHEFALGEGELGLALEAVYLRPGGHLAGGEALLPIVRVTAGMAAALASLPGVVAVAWHPSRAWMERKYFVRAITAWLRGGAFPALGLTALTAHPSGGLRSEGLGFFIGQEVQVLAEPDDAPGDVAKLAVRLIHRLVESGAVHEEAWFSTEDGGKVHVSPAEDRRWLVARRAR